jgi:subfamily B ATP-binding cassette protein MsbA
MKNFVRLVRFAWRYKVRFGLSVGCALMVALLFFTELGAVYPLLHILFGSQNPQRWISEKIVAVENDIAVLHGQETEVALVLDNLRREQPRRDQLNERFTRTSDEFLKKEAELRKHQASLGVVDPKEHPDPDDHNKMVLLEKLKRDHHVAEARVKELETSLALFRKGDKKSLSIRLREIQQELTDDGKLAKRCKTAQPYINKYLPDESFKTLVLLLGLVMLGVALKGFFMFLQEVLVADVMQLTLFDIRNLFFRRTINLDLASFSDQGSSELMARFTNDEVHDVPGRRDLDQLAPDLPDLGLGADFRSHHLPRRQGHEAGRSALAGKHVDDLQDPPGKLSGDQGRQGIRDRTSGAPAIL